MGDFDGGAITSNGGAVLLREADRALGLTGRVARCFRDDRNRELVVHRLETLVAQRIHAIALGYEDINDHEELRHDPVLGLLSDTLEPKRADERGDVVLAVAPARLRDLATPRHAAAAA